MAIFAAVVLVLALIGAARVIKVTFSSIARAARRVRVWVWCGRVSKRERELNALEAIASALQTRQQAPSAQPAPTTPAKRRARQSEPTPDASMTVAMSLAEIKAAFEAENPEHVPS